MLRALCIAAVLVAGQRLAPAQELPGVELFDEPDEMTEGTNLRLEGAVVRAKAGILLRVSVGKHEIFVAPPDPSSLEFLAVGARVDVQGTLQRTPTAQQARLVYAMSRAEARRLAHTKFYVDAWSVSAVD
jgi:hypothetical protein